MTELKRRIFKDLNFDNKLVIEIDDQDKNMMNITKSEKFDQNEFCIIPSDEDTSEVTLHNNDLSSKLPDTMHKDISKEYDSLAKVEFDQNLKSLFIKEFGFTEVIKTMCEHKKPFIGHNCFFDMVYFFRQFISNLPDSFDEFKILWSTAFPLTFDTKFI